MLRSAQPRASGSASTACTWARGTSCAIASAIAPEPVPRSATTGSATSIAVSFSMAQPVITSVSGRGTKTPGPTASSVYLKWVRPVMCWSGSRASRRAISSQNLGSNPASGTRCSSPRRTPCTCAAITSASARGDSTPASASRAAAMATSSSSSVTAGLPDWRPRAAGITPHRCPPPGRTCPPRRGRRSPRPGHRRAPGPGCAPCSRPGDRRSGSPGSCRCAPAATGPRS